MEKITFQFRDMRGYRAVAFNAPLEYFATKIKLNEKGIPVKCIAEMTVKDCRHIDGCVYFAKGRVPDGEMVRLIEFYQKVKDNTGWKKINENLKN